MLRSDWSQRVLVCGGREYQDAAHVAAVLKALDQQGRLGLLMHGAAGRRIVSESDQYVGADMLADVYAKRAGIDRVVFPANWVRYDRAGGPIRNTLMLELGKPSLVVAFPGGAGTRNMVEQARAAGVEVIEPKRTR